MNDDESLTETIDDVLEGGSSDDESILDDEALPFPGGLLPFPFGGNRSPGRSRPYSPAPGMTPWVTQTRFVAEINRLSGDIAKLKDGVKMTGAAVQRTAKATTRTAKLTEKNSKAIVKLARQQKKYMEMSLLLSLMNQPNATEPMSKDVPLDGVSIPAGSRLLYQENDNNSTLPLLLLLTGALGGDDSSGDGMNILPLFFASKGGRL